MSRTFHTSRSCSWVSPRQSLHASERYYRHGPIQPMPEPRRGWFSRLFRREALEMGGRE